MTSPTTDLPAYPMVPTEGLSVDPLYRDLQSRGPIKVQFPYGEPCWLATRYEDVKTVYGDRRFSRALGLQHDMPGIFPGDLLKDPSILLNMDPPPQTRIRRLASGAFSPGRVQQLAGSVRRRVDQLWDDIEAAGPGADFVARFSARLPVLVTAGILGIPEDGAFQFAEWADTLVAVDSTLEQKGEAHHRLREVIAGLIEDRRVSPTDDLLSVLVHARDEGDRLTEAELQSLSLTLWLGGIDTTHHELGSMVFTLLSHPGHWKELVDDPGLLPAALEELWRWIPSHKYGVFFPRWATEDIELSFGTVIPAGEPVYPEHTVANRDESVYPHGWELDFHRVDPAPHLTFAFGAHHCMGSRLAMLEAQLTIAAMVERFPTLALAVPAEDVRWSPSSFLRGAEEIPLTW